MAQDLVGRTVFCKDIFCRVAYRFVFFGWYLVGISRFSWEEKLVAPLIATPNVDKAIEDK